MIAYLLLVAIAFILFIGFRVLRYTSYRVGTVRKFYPIFIAVELGLWIAFIFGMVNYFLSTKSYYKELVLVLVVTAVILVVWFYIKDVVAGFLFRIKHNPIAGQVIRFSNVNGVIKTLAPSQLMIEEEGGKILRIPYSKLLNKSISLDNGDTYSASEVVIYLDVNAGADYTDAERRIKQTLLQFPWCVPHKPIRIGLSPQGKQGIEITFHLVDKSFAEAAKVKVKELFEGN